MLHRSIPSPYSLATDVFDTVAIVVATATVFASVFVLRRCNELCRKEEEAGGE